VPADSLLRRIFVAKKTATKKHPRSSLPTNQALAFKGIIMQTLELKIPPVVQVFVTASLMWTLTIAVPSFGFTLSASSLVAIVFAVVGVAFALRAYWSFGRRAQPSTREYQINPLALSLAEPIE
jgi:hypothetical protein